MPDAELVADIRMFVTELPAYDYHRLYALLRRRAQEPGAQRPTQSANTAS